MSSTPRSIDAGVRIGEIFLEKYRVEAILGHGGMGVVALCTHLALDERVAIKMLRRDVLDDADAVERFMREAQAASKLKSEYVARVTDVGRSAGNVPYMVMEYLEGHDLGQLLDERGSIALPWAVELTLQACEALTEAHSIGIVHRDVKPSNLFVTWRPDGSALIKVLDFGISKALTGNAMQLTQTQSLLGTPAYMSPEQMRSARMVDARTDIWSLGTVLYELLEGRRPFEAESFSEMCVKVAVDPPAAMQHAPAELQQVVLRCLEKTPEHRYASMAELGRDLVPFSHDPHQAQVLVERMSRMLLRSQIGDRAHSAERGAAVTRPSLPALHASRPETPRLSLPALHASQPETPRLSLPALHASQPETPRPSLPTEPRASEPPRFRSSTTYAVPRRKRRGAALVAAALVGAATISALISLARDRMPGDSAITDPPVQSTPVASPPVPGSAAAVTDRDAGTASDRAASERPAELREPPHPRETAASPVVPARGSRKSGKLDADKPRRPKLRDCELDPFGSIRCTEPKRGGQGAR